MKIHTKIILLAILFLLQSCSGISNFFTKTDCSKANQELNLRYALFEKLSPAEIKKRRKTTVPSVSSLEDLSVFSKIVAAAKSAPEAARIIPVDLRYYQEVDFGNIIISNASRDSFLKVVRTNSKHSQGLFALINFNSESISIFPAAINPLFTSEKINRTDLEDVEIVFNVSDSGHIAGNMKFAPDQKVSIIANRITKPYRLDLREYSNLQYHLNDKWIMPVYSIENSQLLGGKDTTGFFKLVNNYKTISINLDKSYRSVVSCYTDSFGPKL